jgi:uncharacterized FAD-dependent dehydrogenase
LPHSLQLSKSVIHFGTQVLDAEALQRGDVLVALLALGEQAEQRSLVIAQGHEGGSLCDAH